MEIEGIIVSGMGKGTYFMSQAIYRDEFAKKLNFKPFVGTLNVGVDSNGIRTISQIPREKFGIINGQGKFGDVKFVKASLNNKIEGALVFPRKTKHPNDVLEFIAEKNLRNTLKLEDGDFVTIKIEGLE
jgi:riboflavin kinase, archaea type